MPESLHRLAKPESACPDDLPPMLVGRPTSPGWVRVADLADPSTGSLRAALDAMASVRGYPDPITIGAGFALITSSAMAELTWRAVRSLPLPDLSPDTTWWQIRPSANVDAIAIDPSPPLVSPTQLAPILHNLLDPLYHAIMTETGFPIRAQWSMLTSAIADWLLTGLRDDPSLAVELANRLFASDKLLTVAKPRFTWFDHHGQSRAFSTRRVCCFNYRGKRGHYCTSQCPIVPADQRLAYAIDREARD